MAVAQSAVTFRPLTALELTVNVAATVPKFPSVTDTSLTVRVGSGSSSVIVPSPDESEIVALTAFESVTV